MANTQLLDYIKQQMALGLSRETIQSNLATSGGGWSLADINEAFSSLGIGQNIPTAPAKYAGFWIRFVAFMVDQVILIIPVIIIQIVVAVVITSIGIKISNGADEFIGYTVPLLVLWIYFSLMTYYKGATLGKMLVGITVKSDDLKKLSLKKVVLRETVGKFASGIILGIGYIVAGFTERKRAVHDMFAHSVVVYKDPSQSHKAGLIVGIIIATILPIIMIVGILSSVVLVSLNTAREKGRDARTRANIMSIRANAEIYYSINNNSYSTANNCSSGMFADKNIQAIISNMTDTKVTCYAEDKSYAVSAKLSTPGSSYCIDNEGYSGEGMAVDMGSKASCGGLI
ncbi:MAG: RDD family protein [Candidatus Paceibacterota bacterium]|jgi:uncharacterized RDD family membrane protein YckC